MKRLVGRAALLLACGLMLVAGTMTAAPADDDPVPSTAPNVQPGAAPLALITDDAESADGPQFSWPLYPSPAHPVWGGIRRPDWEAVLGTTRPGGSAQGSADSMVHAARGAQSIRLPYVQLVGDHNSPIMAVSPGDPVRQFWIDWTGLISVLPPGAGPTDHPAQRFGEFPPTRVRSVAFGSVPVTYTIHVSQVRDDDDFPVPFYAHQKYGGSAVESGAQYYDDANLSGQVMIRVADLVVDGVPVNLGSQCRTARPVDVSMTGRGFLDRDLVRAGETGPETDKFVGDVGDNVAYDAAPMEVKEREGWRHTEYFSILQGGLLTGTVDIPPFIGCGGGSEDLSGLITSVASGPGNDMQTRAASPTSCGLNYYEAYSQVVSTIPGSDPMRQNWWVATGGACRIPAPFPFPTVDD